MLRRDSADVTSAILPIRNVDLTSLPIARIVLILKAELFLRPQRAEAMARRLTVFQTSVEASEASSAERKTTIAVTKALGGIAVVTRLAN